MYLVTAKQMQNIDKTTIESFGIPGQVLMENAGRGAFEMLLRLFPDIADFRVCILAGRGNNGGDAFVIARYLVEKGIRTTTFVLSSKAKISGDAGANLLLLEKISIGKNEEKGEQEGKEKKKKNLIIEIPDMETYHQMRNRMVHHDLFIDGILGTGLNSNVRNFYKEVIDTVNGLKKPVFSIDIPSGLNADTGQPMGTCISAAATATFAFAKVGHMLQPGKRLTGALEIIDIGIPGFIAEKEILEKGIVEKDIVEKDITEKETPLISLIDKEMISPLFPIRPFDSHKGTYGHLMVVAGSIGKTGAAALACNAAMACGTGLVTLGIPESINTIMEPQVTETMTLPLPDNPSVQGTLSASAMDIIKNNTRDNAQNNARDNVKNNGRDNTKNNGRNKSALALGPGLGLTPDTIKLVQAMITHPSFTDLPMIIDADALNALAEESWILKKRKAPTILTPHPGEMARLTGKTTAEIQENRIKSAQQFAEAFNVIVVLKGAGTVVALPDNSTYLCPTGNPGMASGGMGDVLTGMIAGFMAQGFTAQHAALAGVYIHGLCGDILAATRGKFGFSASDIIKIIPETIHNDIL